MINDSALPDTDDAVEAEAHTDAPDELVVDATFDLTAADPADTDRWAMERLSP